MAQFGSFYLDKEKDIVVELDRTGDRLAYELRTPNHGTGNLITNLATLFRLPISFDDAGLKVVRGEIPCYVDGQNRKVWIFRLGNTKAANIYADGTIERKAEVPAIAKTLMSQTKDYLLEENKTLVKTYIRSEVKFRSDLHTHRSGNLNPDILIALGIHHGLRYPYYYVKKLGLKLTEAQRAALEDRRAVAAEKFAGCGLTGKYLDRRIDDNTEINFADLVLSDPANAAFNIPKIRASLAVRKDGQAVFTDLEKVYLYRYVFTKGLPSAQSYPGTAQQKAAIPDADVRQFLAQMEQDRLNPAYKNNTLYQDELLWVARSYASVGISYAEISDTALVRRSDAADTLAQIHGVMPAVTAETGVVLRFLAALRRIPLSIVKDKMDQGNYFEENLEVLRAVASDPYVAGSDFVGEEINDIRELRPVIRSLCRLTEEDPSFTIRIHAGENDSLPDNVLNSILCVEESLAPGQAFPRMRIGHGLYTAKLGTPKGRLLVGKLREYGVVLEFQITSNVRLNNLSRMEIHPLKQYLANGIACVQGTDGGALYGTDSLDEQLSLDRMLGLSYEEMLSMRRAEDRVLERSLQAFEAKKTAFAQERGGREVKEVLQQKLAQEQTVNVAALSARQYDPKKELAEFIEPLPADKIPIVVAGGSFNNAAHRTKVGKMQQELLENLLASADPEKIFFVIGPGFSGYEEWIRQKAQGKFQVAVFVPAALTKGELKKARKAALPVRVSIEASPMGVYKSFAYEIFKRRQSIILAMDGNSAAANLIQDAKNSKYKSRTFINAGCRALAGKAESLQGYVTMLQQPSDYVEILKYADRFYDLLGQPTEQILKKPKKKA